MSEASAVEALLFAALDKPTADERAAFLDSACGSDAELRRQVDKLLQAHANVGNFLQKPVVEQLAVTPELADATQELAGSTDGPGAVRPGGTGVYLERTEGGAASDRGALDFLEPSARPESLGRLGHYEVLEVLGKGGFGVVYRAFDEQLQRVVAIKVLSPEMAATAAARKRFLREARSSARVRHDNVVEVYAVEEQPLPYLVMEFVPGETLQQQCDRIGGMEVTDVVRIGRQIAEGLAAVHARGLIHRDIKPGNILIEAGPNEPVKITDFGLARAADDASLSQSGTIAGTPMYMAPEQASAGRLDHRADLFSLGSVLYTMCTGRPPFRAPSTLAVLKRVVEDTPRPIREIIPETPAWLCDLIAKLHAKKPDDRFATTREVADLLGRGLTALQSGGIVKPPAIAVPTVVPIKLRSQVTPEAAPTTEPRFRIRRWLVAAAVLLTLLGGLSVTEATGVTNVRGTVIRLFSPDGTLVVEVDDPGVSVQIDGSDIIIRGAGVKEIRLKPGSYTVKGIKDGQVLSRELVNITRDGKQVVRVSQEARPDDNKGIVAEATYPDRRAAEYVLSLGGSVKVNGIDQEIRAASDLPREKFRLCFVKLRGSQGVTDADLAVFKGCTNLTQLMLQSVRVTDVGLAHFQDCRNLKEVWLDQTLVTDAWLAIFKDNTQLIGISLSSTQLTDAGLAHFKGCKNLTGLSLQNTQLTDAGLSSLNGLDKLTQLYLQNTKVTANGVEALAKSLPRCKISWNGGTIKPDESRP